MATTEQFLDRGILMTIDPYQSEIIKLIPMMFASILTPAMTCWP